MTLGRSTVAVLFLTAGAVSLSGAEAADQAEESVLRPAHTYSIVARDDATGQIGVAVQSHWFQVGNVVAWAQAGVGAVATQSFVESSYGPRGLRLMGGGHSAREALDALLEEDPGRDLRQVAMVDARGSTAAWTGPRCIAQAGHLEGPGFSVQANLMEKDTVWGAMAQAYTATQGRPLAERLLAALKAAQGEGGDIRGRQSAALIVVRAKTTGRPWQDRLVDLRVDDAAKPLVELARLYRLQQAYAAMNEGDEALAAGDTDKALDLYSQARLHAPEIVEIPFWVAVTMFSAGREAEALPIFEEVFARESRWREVVRRLPKAGLLPGDPAKLHAILAAGSAGGDSGGRP